MRRQVFVRTDWNKTMETFIDALKTQYELPDTNTGAFFMNKIYAEQFAESGEFHEKDKIDTKLKYLPAIISRDDVEYSTAISLTEEISSEVLDSINQNPQYNYFLKSKELVEKINQNPETYVKICKEVIGHLYIPKRS